MTGCSDLADVAEAFARERFDVRHASRHAVSLFEAESSRELVNLGNPCGW